MPQDPPPAGIDVRKLRRYIADLVAWRNAMEAVPIQILMGDGSSGTGHMTTQGNTITIVLNIPSTSA